MHRRAADALSLACPQPASVHLLTLRLPPRLPCRSTIRSRPTSSPVYLAKQVATVSKRKRGRVGVSTRVRGDLESHNHWNKGISSALRFMRAMQTCARLHRRSSSPSRRRDARSECVERRLCRAGAQSQWPSVGPFARRLELEAQTRAASHATCVQTHRSHRCCHSHRVRVMVSAAVCACVQYEFLVCVMSIRRRVDLGDAQYSRSYAWNID